MRVYLVAALRSLMTSVLLYFSAMLLGIVATYIVGVTQSKGITIAIGSLSIFSIKHDTGLMAKLDMNADLIIGTCLLIGLVNGFLPVFRRKRSLPG